MAKMEAGTAVATIGGATIEYCLQDDVLPGFMKWLNRDGSHFTVPQLREDLQTVLSLLPPVHG